MTPSGDRIEVEIKARVDDPGPVESALARLGRPLDEIDYYDAYYKPSRIPGFTHQRFRLRKTPDKILVTVKELVRAGGCEASLEHEFEVDDAEAFLGFARVFGFSLMLEKRKRGRRWRVDTLPGRGAIGPLTAEVVQIEGLGWFLEVEIMERDPDRIPADREAILALLDRLGISPQSIEPRPYTLLLYERQSRAEA